YYQISGTSARFTSHLLSLERALFSSLLNYPVVHLYAGTHCRRHGNALYIYAFRRCRLGLHYRVHDRTEILTQLLGSETLLPEYHVTYRRLVYPVFYLTGFDISYRLGYVHRDRPALGVGHQALGSEYLT